MTCHRLTVSTLTLLLACGSDPQSNAFDTDTPQTTADSTGTTEGAEGTEDPASSSGDVDPTDSPATGVDPDAEVGCDAVDFLFVIDNSGSMADEQQQLVESVPGFVAAIEERLPAGTGTYHVMVTDTDPWVYGGCDDACTECVRHLSLEREAIPA